MKKWIYQIVLSSILTSGPLAFARQCGEVVFDCNRNIATMNGARSPLDCGVSTPTHYRGRIGARGRAAGSRWKCLANKPKVDLGLGAVIAHTPCGNRLPKGQNQTFNGSGCMNLSPSFLSQLSSCQGTPFKIDYSSKGSHASKLRKHRNRRNQQHSDIEGDVPAVSEGA